MQTTVTQSKLRLTQPLRTLFAVLVTPYIIMLTAYLLLRLAFGDRFWWLSLLNTFAHLLFLPLVLLLPLAILLRARGSVFRLLPLALVGGLWITPYYLPKAAPAPNGQTLRVLTFNVWGRNHDLRHVEAWLRQEQPDIAVLQEISPAYAVDHLPSLLDLYPYQSTQPDSPRWGGNITLSRFPVISMEFVDLHVPNEAAPLRIVVEVNGDQIAIYNVHLAWPVRQSPRLPLPPALNSFYLRVALGFDDRARNQQVQALLAHLQNEPLPYIVAGDFNTSDQSATYQQLAAAMTDSFREAGQGWRGSWPVSSARGLPSLLPPLIRIDYIWHSEQFDTLAAARGPALGSDHLPMLATLMLKNQP